MRRSFSRIAATLLLAVGVVTCTDSPTAPTRTAHAARVRLAPQFAPDAERAFAALGAQALAVNNVRVIIQRPPAETLADTTLLFPPGADSVAVDLTVTLQANTEQLLADVQLRDANGVVLFEGRSTITVSLGLSGPSISSPVTLSYVGPGSGATTLLVAPSDSTLILGRAAQLTASAFDAGGKPVTNLPLAWVSSNAAVVKVDASGLVTAVGLGSATITAEAANGLSAHATLRVVNPPSKLVLAGGDAQTGAAGQALAQPFVVQVLASDGSPLAGIPVAFSAVTTGGAIAPATVTSDAGGKASATPTLGNTPGSYAFQASASGLASVTIHTTATAGAPAALALVSGGGQADSVGNTLAQPLVVKVTDRLGNAVAGAGVSWSATAGSVSASSTSSDSGGLTSIHFTLGGTPGADTVRAQLAAATGAGTQAMFVETARARGPSLLAVISGSGQSAVVATALAQPLVVEAQDAKGNKLAGLTVGWRVAAGTGTLSAATTTTDSTGRTSVSFTTGTKAGVDSVLATVANTSISAAFAETGTAGAVALVTKVAGDGQTAAVGTVLPINPAVKVTDANGNPIGAKAVTFTVTAGGGTVTGGSTITDATGLATVGSWKLGSTPGTNGLQATADNVGTGFTATATLTAGRVATLTVSPHADTLASLADVFSLTSQSRDATGAPAVDTVTWVSRTPAAVTVSAAGVVTAVANGSSYVVASDASGKKDSALVLVQQRVASVSVTPGTRSIYLTRTYTFTASAVDGRGNAIAGSPTFTWTSNAPSTASVGSGTGIVTGLGLGSAQITATTGGVSGVASVSVLTPITRIVVGRDSSGVPVADTTSLTALGRTRTYIAVAHDTLDAPMSGVTFNWASTNASVAGLDSVTATTARATASANGITAVQATAQGVTGQAALDVSQMLTSIQVTPGTASIAPTGTVAMLARGLDANARYISGGTFTYASSNTGVATVNASTGLVTGVAIGTTNVTASSGAITSAPAVVTVSNTVPAKINFSRDTLAVGRGSSTSIPILLSTPSASAVTVNLAVRDTFAYFNPTSITIPAGQTSANATLYGHNAGTTLIYATDGSSTGYAADTSVLAVQATVRLTSTGYGLNATDQVSTQVLLSDPSPAGGTYVTFAYGTAGVANVSPDPAFIPVGQLAANVVLKGLAQGTTTVTPSAVGVNGTSSNVQAYPANLTFSTTSTLLGAGQYYQYYYVYIPTNNATPVPLTFTSSDTNVVPAPTGITIPSGSNYAYFTTTAKGVGTATLTVTAPGWTATNNLGVIVSTPHVGVCCGTTYNTTTPTQTIAVYSEDSVKTGHNRTNSLVVRISSSDTTVLKVLDTTVTIAPGYYYNNSVRVIPGGAGGTAWVHVSAGGHTSDSTLFTVVGPKLRFSAKSALLGVGQEQPNFYVYTPNNVTAPLTVTLTNTDSTKIAVPATVTVLNGSNYVYFDARAYATGTVTIIASAPGYQPDTATYVATTPRLVMSGGGTVYNFGPAQNFQALVTDSMGATHQRFTPLSVHFQSTDTAVVRVDSSATIQPGYYYTAAPQLRPVALGTAKILATAPGHTIGDTITVTVIAPKIALNTHAYRIGARQHASASDFYVYTPNTRTSNLPVTLTQKHPTVVSLTATSLVVDSATNYTYFSLGGLVPGVDTIISSAAGYVPDTLVVVVTTPHLGNGNLPGSATTTTPPFTITLYATDSVGSAHYASDTVAVHMVSSDTTVLKPDSAYMHVVKNNYYGQAVIRVVGPGTATIAYADSAASGYVGTTSNTITVTGPSLSMSSGSIMLGMRQNTGPNGVYVYTPNNVTAPLTVHLLSTSTRVAAVTDSVIIGTGNNYAYFTISGLDTIGTIQVQATATGYNATATTVQVTQPRFAFSTATSARTTQSRLGITVYAQDANGGNHYANENVVVTLASSAASVATVDSATVTIAAGQYYNSAAGWHPVAVGTTQLTATDTRAAYYKYTTATANLTVTTPQLNFNWGTTYLGLGQYIDNAYVYTPDNMTANASVALSHTGTARTSTVPASPVTIPAGSNYVYFRLLPAAIGTDTLVGTLSSPQHNPATAYTVVDSGRVDPLSGWPASLSLSTGDSAQITLYARDPGTGVRNVLNATTFTLAPNANIQFVTGGSVSTVITSATIPASANYVQFWVKGVSAGTASATITAAGYRTYMNTLTVSP